MKGQFDPPGVRTGLLLEGVTLQDFQKMIDKSVEKAVRSIDSTLLSQREAAKRLGIGVTAFKRLGLPGYKVSHSIRYRLSDLPLISKEHRV